MNLTPQEMLDKSYRALKKQGRQSRREGGGYCMYIGPDGARCAVGHIVDKRICKTWDDDYCYSDSSIENIVAEEPDRVPAYIVNNLEFAKALQQAHDFWEPYVAGSLEAQFEVVAKDFGLVAPGQKAA